MPQTQTEKHLQNLLEMTGVKKDLEKMQGDAALRAPTACQVSLCKVETEGIEINMNEDWCDVEFEVALDSGSQDHVCDEADTSGYALSESPGSSRGSCFVVGDGGRIPHLGQKVLNLEPEADESVGMKSCFQIARVTRPLTSVGKICDGGVKVEFTDKTATIKAQDGKTACVFTRKPGGLYICKMRLKQPFPRPE